MGVVRRGVGYHFGPTECEIFYEALACIKQHTSLRDFQREFEKLANRVVRWPQFLAGLKEEIVAEVRMFKPQTLRETIDLARMRDEKLTRKKRLVNVDSQRSTQVSQAIITTLTGTAPPKQSQYCQLRKSLRMRCKGDVRRACALRKSLRMRCNVVQAFLIEKDGHMLVEHEEEENEENEGTDVSHELSKDNLEIHCRGMIGGYKLSTSISHLPP